MQVVIVPDRHGFGTNALVISPPAVFKPSFGPDSLNRHVGAAQEAGLKHSVEEVPSLLHDVDTPEDLAALEALLDDRRACAPMTRGALRQLDRLRENRRFAQGVEPPVEV
jgi:2-phospho-L-lactate guanylyltransferase